MRTEDIISITEFPEESKIFTQDHIDHVFALTGQILLNDLKGQLLNIVEGAGMPERQETAIKRQITNALHEAQRETEKSLEFARCSNDCLTCVHNFQGTPDTAKICEECKIISRGYQKYSFNTNIIPSYCNNVD